MMDFWREVAEKQERKIEVLVNELMELKTKAYKEHEEKNKYKDQRMPTIDVKDVKRHDEYDGDQKNFTDQQAFLMDGRIQGSREFQGKSH